MKYSEIVSASEKVLVDFTATWCGPCKTQGPILEQLKQKLGSTLKIVKIDIDKNAKLAANQGVQSVPTLVFYKNGKQIWRKSGVQSLDQLLKSV